MRVFECKLTYSLVSLGEEIRLDRPEKVADYLRSAFDDNPMQEAFYCVYLDRKNHPLGRHLITLGTVDSTLVSCREVFRGAIVAGCSALVVAHNLCAAAHRLCYVTSRAMWSACGPFTRGSLCA
ncbi:JAB domain-containing protein [Opitutus terrae]|nr:JAB domain-containing protein [Opitutus terrae]